MNAALVRRIEMVQAWGRGMPLILQNAPDVEVREVASLFVASFERTSATAVTTQETTKETPKTGQKTSQKTGLKTGLKKTAKRQATILQQLRQQPQTSVTDLAHATGLSPNGVKYHLTQLKQAGQLKRIGPDKGSHWQVTEPDPKGNP